jgi:hypothetical protein
MKETVSFSTDTATICVFDTEAIKHRLNDVDDWWSDPFEELDEVNKGNVLFVALGSDGQYSVIIRSGQKAAAQGTAGARLRCQSGRFFVGPGEQVSAGGVGPNTKAGGAFIDVGPGHYVVSVSRVGPFELEMTLESTTDISHNTFSSPLTI